jgi:hypothetical protein
MKSQEKVRKKSSFQLDPAKLRLRFESGVVTQALSIEKNWGYAAAKRYLQIIVNYQRRLKDVG